MTKRKYEEFELPFETIEPCMPVECFSMVIVGQDCDGYDYYSTSYSAPIKKRLVSIEDSKQSISHIKKCSRSATLVKAKDVRHLPVFLREMAELQRDDVILGLSIFRYEDHSGSFFNAEVYNDYRLEDFEEFNSNDLISKPGASR